jgi:hypothetical protein
MSINVSNASSYACNDLLRNCDNPVGLVQFVLEESRVKKPSAYPRSPSKLKLAINKLKRDFQRYGGVKLILRPLGLSVRPSLNKKYLDRRGYYPKRKYTAGYATLGVTPKIIYIEI